MMKKQVWLVSDRSFDDILVKHMYRKTLTPSVIKTVRRFIPRTEKTIWLQTDPAAAMKRDQEFPESYYRGLQECYCAAAKQFGWEIVPTTQRSPEAVWADVKSILDLQVTDHS
jgi:thymidylate kinase